jgi:hypothetical protein
MYVCMFVCVCLYLCGFVYERMCVEDVDLFDVEVDAFNLMFGMCYEL